MRFLGMQLFATIAVALAAISFHPVRLARDRDEIDRVADAIPRRLILTFDISQLPSPRNWAMRGGSNGYQAALVRRQLTPGLISSLPGTVMIAAVYLFFDKLP